ncbi:hypothetical protein AGMMS50212_05510 [Spirochaetia bacterium]|nr:hypothetical protein AGMMS50212_05510 [Spirochaetia bacterium]
MQKTKEQLETKINESKYFSITGENIEALRKTELNKLSATIFEYCHYIYHNQTKELGLEIHKCVISCLKTFNPKNGKFINYFMSSLKNVNNSIKIKENRDVERYKNISDLKKNNEDCDFQIVDTVSPTPEEKLITRENTIEYFSAFENIYRGKQGRVKKYLQKLLTVKYLEEIIELESISDSTIYTNFSFVDHDIYENYRNDNNPPTQKEIAESLGKHEADASRTLARFEKLVKSIISSKKC